jgi:hypothetical protein
MRYRPAATVSGSHLLTYAERIAYGLLSRNAISYTTISGSKPRAGSLHRLAAKNSAPDAQ